MGGDQKAGTLTRGSGGSSGLASTDSTPLSHLIDRIYEAGMVPEAWPSVLGELAGALNAKSGLLRTLDLQEGRRVLARHHHNPDPPRQAEYCARYVGADPYLERLKGFPPGRMAPEDQVLDRTAYRKTPFYQHYLKPLDNHSILGGYVERQGGLRTILGLHRSSRAAPFGRAEREARRMLESRRSSPPCARPSQGTLSRWQTS